MTLLRGKQVDLCLVERDDYAAFLEWWQDWEFRGPYVVAIPVRTRHEADEQFLRPTNPSLEFTRFFIQRKDGARVGGIVHFWGSPLFEWMEIGYATAISERGKGFATEAVQIMIDYLFQCRPIERIQAHVDVDNLTSRKVLENAGFVREGELRKASWIRGRWTNAHVYSVTREDWKGPHVLQG